MRLLSVYFLLTASFLSSHELQKFNLSLDFLETDEFKEIEMNIKVPRNYTDHIWKRTLTMD